MLRGKPVTQAMSLSRKFSKEKWRNLGQEGLRDSLEMGPPPTNREQVRAWGRHILDSHLLEAPQRVFQPK